MVGTLLIVVAAVLWVTARPTPAGQSVNSVGATGALELTAEPPGTSGTAAAPAADPAQPSAVAPHAASPQPAAAAPPVATDQPQEAAAAPGPATAGPEPVPGSPPSRVRIPALAVDAPVSAVGIADDGEVEVPDDVGTVGWYRFGPAPGEQGSSVLVGHVDDYRQGVGVLARIGDLNPGDTVEVTGENGVASAFTVVAREQWPKADAPLDRLFDRGGSARLVLLTCGGAFDDARLEYTDNIAVTAIPSTP